MMKHVLCLAGVLTMTSAGAFAQTADRDHPAPGDGYRIPVVKRMSHQPLAAYQTNPSVPGDGYRIAQVMGSTARPLAAYQTLPGVPGDGYRMK